MIWRSGNVATPLAVAAVTNQDWIVAGVGDFDGDHFSDILWRNTVDGRNRIWRSGNASAQHVGGGDRYQSGLDRGRRGDFDGDLFSDIFWRNTVDGRNRIWRWGNASTQLAVAAVTDQSWIVAGVGDFDGDFFDDIFWRNTITGANAIWRSGNVTTQLAVATVANQNWIVAGVGGFNDESPWDY